MPLLRVELFSRKDFLYFLALCAFILFYSLLIEYKKYRDLTRFDSAIISATVIKQYPKTTNSKRYQILKLKTKDNLSIYTSVKESFADVRGKTVKFEIYPKIDFYQYLTTFYTYSRVKHIYKNSSLKAKLNSYVASQHRDKKIANLYQALFSATPLSQELQQSFSTLGVSHLLAISGFHLGVLSALLFFLLKSPYTFLQNRYFPYRNSKIDIFIAIAIILLAYLLFLDSPPSLLRAYAMLLIGFILYDRGIEIVSMQTLLVTLLLLLSFFPRLLFSLGFWLSISGVFYIFLFLIHFKDLSKLWQFILVPFWTYLLMLPFSLVIFHNFSIYHPLSIVWTSLFSIFYPLSIFLHLLNCGDLMDTLLNSFILLAQKSVLVNLDYRLLIFGIILSFIAIYKRAFIWLLLALDSLIFIYAVYHIA